MNHEQAKHIHRDKDSKSGCAAADLLLNDSSPCKSTQNALSEKHSMSRHEFRKMQKLQRRKTYRQAKALERQERKRRKLVEEEAQHDRYAEQRDMWLAKETMFDKISAAKQKAREIEAEAAQTMNATVDKAVSLMTLPPKRPMYIAAKQKTSYKTPQIPNMPKFVRSKNDHED